jgi:hypothetical protein
VKTENQGEGSARDKGHTVRAKLVARPQDYRYSSYRSYVSENKDDLIHRDLILEIIAQDGNDAAKQFRDFAEGALAEKLKNPLKEVYGGQSWEGSALSGGL